MPKPLNTERQSSFDQRTLGDLSTGFSPNRFSMAAENSLQNSDSDHFEPVYSPVSPLSFDCHPVLDKAWKEMRRSLVYFHGNPMGTTASSDDSEANLIDDQVFARDFIVSGLAFLMGNETKIVKNFILKALCLQPWAKKSETANFGHNPTSGLWWIILLQGYTKSTRDLSLADLPRCQKGMRNILSLYMSEMGVYGYPIDIQALFFMALKAASYLLKPDSEGNTFIERIGLSLKALSFHVREKYWMEFKQLNYMYKTEGYPSLKAVDNNVIPDWFFDFVPDGDGGYFIGSADPEGMDFTWFCLGNALAVISSLATPEQSAGIMDLIESRWEELVGDIPGHVCYPAIERQVETGSDPKNTRWRYHRSWPVLLWALTAASIKMRRPWIGRSIVSLVETRLAENVWSEYYDGPQTWPVAGYLVAKLFLDDPSRMAMISPEEDWQPAVRRSSSRPS